MPATWKSCPETSGRSRITKDAAVQGRLRCCGGMIRIMTGQTMQAADAGLKAAEAGMQAARAGLDAARRYISAEVEAGAETARSGAEAAGRSPRAGKVGNLASPRRSQSICRTPPPILLTAGRSSWVRPVGRRRKRRLIGALRPAKARRAWIIRKRSPAKRSLRAASLHNPSEIPDNYVIFINGEQASKADVLRLAPQKIKRMEVLRGKGGRQRNTAPAAGRNQDYDAQIAAGNRRQPEGGRIVGLRR